MLALLGGILMFNLKRGQAGAGSPAGKDHVGRDASYEDDEVEEEVEEEVELEEEVTVPSTSSSLASLPSSPMLVTFAPSRKLVRSLTPIRLPSGGESPSARFEARAKSSGRRVELEVAFDRRLLIVRPIKKRKKADPTKESKKLREEEEKQRKQAEKDFKKQSKKSTSKLHDQLVAAGMEEETPMTNKGKQKEMDAEDESANVMILDLNDLDVIERARDKPAVRLVWRDGSASQARLVDSKRHKKSKEGSQNASRQDVADVIGENEADKERRETHLSNSLLSPTLGASLGTVEPSDVLADEEKKEKDKTERKRKGSFRLLSSLHKVSQNSQTVRKIMKGADIGAIPVGDIVNEKFDRLVKRAERHEIRKHLQERYKFISAEVRQRFYEAIHAARGVDEDDYDRDNITLFIGTWNMGNAPPPDKLDDWIPKNVYDMYFIGTQESTYEIDGTNPEDNMKLSGEHFQSHLEAHMGAGYTLVAKRSLWAIRSFLFVRNELASKITNLDTSSIATGVGEMLGNKGAVGLSFDFDETSLCLISSHFAAHEKNVEDRNQNYADISSSLELRKYKGCELVNSHDHLFWCGDLNYRIQMERTRVMEAIDEKDWPTLLSNDQLIREMKHGRCFPGFLEGEINFAPTYRMLRGTREYNDEKERVPSWCDRVLWRSMYANEVKLIEYSACNSLTTSDHSPVRAVFVVPTLSPPRKAFSAAAPCTITITDLKATGLPPMNGDGSSDPYIKFLAPTILNEPPKTVCIKKTVDPVWPRDGVPTLFPFVWDREQLVNQHIYLVVKDWNKRLKNRNMGQAVLPLADACGPSPAHFSVPVYRNGHPSGTLMGNIHVVWMSDEPEVADTARRIEQMSEDDAWRLLEELLDRESTPDPRVPLLALLRGDPSFLSRIRHSSLPNSST